jgi:sarcosine oxidase, subunit gamma
LPVEVRSALAARVDDLARVPVREVDSLAQVDVRVAPAPTSAALPLEPNTWVPNGDREVLWLGPDEWLVVGPSGREDSIWNELERALGGLHHSVVDVSAARAILELDAPGRLDLLSHGCGIDLHPRSWRDGMCAQTLLARLPVIIQEREASTRVFVRPSYANHLVDWFVHIVDARP